MFSDRGANELIQRLCIIIVEDKLCGFGDIVKQYSDLYRISYGEMKCDMNLLDFCSDYVKTIDINSKYIFPIRKYSKKLKYMHSAIDRNILWNLLK